MLKVPKLAVGTRGEVNRAARGAFERWCRSRSLSAFGEVVEISQADNLTVYLSDDRVSMSGCCVGLIFPRSDWVSPEDSLSLMDTLLETDWGGWCLLGIRTWSVLDDPRRTALLLDWAATAFVAASDECVFPSPSRRNTSIWSQPSAVYAALGHRGLVDGSYVDSVGYREVVSHWSQRRPGV